MRRTFKIRFYCRESRRRKDGTAPVEISVIVDGTREIFSLPRSCEPSKFPTPDLKAYCVGIEKKFNEIYTALSLADEPISAFILKDIYLNGARKVSYTLAQMFADGLSLKSSEDPGLTAYRKYELVKRHFYEKTGLNPNREAGSVTHADILAFKASLDAVHKPQTVQKEMTRLKYFFNLAWNSGKIKRNPFAQIKIRRVVTENVYLTAEELTAIADAQITNDTLDRVRDAFVFMAGTGLEYADMETLRTEDVKTDGTRRYIRKKRVKTGVEYLTVLTDRAAEIWDFYGGKIPLLSNQKMNAYLKKVAEIARITGKNVSTLTARHTFATQRLNEGLSMEVVSRMLGHLDTKQTRVYAKLLDNTVFDALDGLERQQSTKVSPEVRKAPEKAVLDEEDIEWFNRFANGL